MPVYYSNGEIKQEETEARTGKIYYLVDTENPGSSVVTDLLREGMEKREIYFFYTSNSIKPDFEMIEWMIQYHESMYFEKCFCGAKNSLDFQLVSFLGALIREKGIQNRYIILSNDGGFESVVEFWKRKGVDILRIGQGELGQLTEPVYQDESALSEKKLTDFSKVKILHVASAVLGTQLRERGIFTKHVSQIVDYIYEYRDYTQNALESIVGCETAKEILEKISKEEVDAIIQESFLRYAEYN